MHSLENYISLFSLYILGNSSQCPPPVNAEDNTTCVDNGRCHNGECNPFCEAEQNLQSCACNGKEQFICHKIRGKDVQEPQTDKKLYMDCLTYSSQSELRKEM